MPNRSLVDEIVSRMNNFASNTKSDFASVQVARIAQKLHLAERQKNISMTDEEMRVVSMFKNRRVA